MLSLRTVSLAWKKIGSTPYYKLFCFRYRFTTPLYVLLLGLRLPLHKTRNCRIIIILHRVFWLMENVFYLGAIAVKA